MNQNYTTLIIIALAALIFAAITLISLKLAKKKGNPVETLEVIGTGITYAQSIATAISPFLPDVADDIITVILSKTQQAVTHTEATYKAAVATGTAVNDTRAIEATSLIKSALALEGIEDTAQIDKLIGAIIPVIVLALPKTHEDAAVAPVADTATVPTV